MGIITDYRDLNLEVDKRELIRILNSILKSAEKNTILDINDDWDKIKEVEKTILFLRFSKFILIDKDIYSTSLPILRDNSYKNGISNWSNDENVMLKDLECISDDKYVIVLLEEDRNSVLSWIHILSNISYKECIIDDYTVEDSRGFEFVWYTATHIISQRNGNFHYNYYPSSNYNDLINGDKHALHFGELIIYELCNKLTNIKIRLEENWYISSKEYDKRNRQIDKIKEEIAEIRKRLPEINIKDEFILSLIN